MCSAPSGARPHAHHVATIWRAACGVGQVLNVLSLNDQIILDCNSDTNPPTAVASNTVSHTSYDSFFIVLYDNLPCD